MTGVSFYTAPDGAKAGLQMPCPCGCGVVQTMPFRPWRGNPGWQWDGNEASPTVTPTLVFYAGDGVSVHWRGTMTAGVLAPC